MREVTLRGASCDMNMCSTLGLSQVKYKVKTSSRDDFAHECQCHKHKIVEYIISIQIQAMRCVKELYNINSLVKNTRWSYLHNYTISKEIYEQLQLLIFKLIKIEK